jgi:hypothetical protein
MSTILSNISLVLPTIGIDSGLIWEQSFNANMTNLDNHDHSSGKGLQIQPNGMLISSDLAFLSNNATQLRSTRFISQVSVLAGAQDVACLYVVGNELYYNDYTGGNHVQITLNGNVNATSSGISSGTATAAFSSGVLLVKGSSTTAASVEMLSCILTNSGNLTNLLTLQAPTLSSSLLQTLPLTPGATSFMTMDASGNMGASIAIAGGITGSNIAASTIAESNIVPATITTASISASAGILGSQLAQNTVTPFEMDTYTSALYGSQSTTASFSFSTLSVNGFPSVSGASIGASPATNRPIFLSFSGQVTIVTTASGGGGVGGTYAITFGAANTNGISLFTGHTQTFTITLAAGVTYVFPLSVFNGFYIPAASSIGTRFPNMYGVINTLSGPATATLASGATMQVVQV